MDSKRKCRRGLKKVVIAEVEPGPDGRKCPFHYGLRTYFHNIVEPQEKEIIETVDYLEEADFDYKDRVRKNCSWEKACIWCGVPLLLMGVVAVLVGQLTPPREVLLKRGSLTYLDRKAISYNQRLEVCRLAGLAALCTAALMILLSFLMAAYTCPSTSPSSAAHYQEYCPVLTATDTTSGIPLSGILTTVQPPATPLHPRR